MESTKKIPGFKHDKAARKMGWIISYTGQQDATHNTFELQRVDEMEIFKSDEKAHQHVVLQAANNPNGIEADALRYLAKYSPNEVDSVIRGSMGHTGNFFEKVLEKLNIKL